jgi:acyl-CoA synthetase (AMP-forming)/AMP-acid ligase II
MNPYLFKLLRHFEEPDRIFSTIIQGERSTTIRWGDLAASARMFLHAYHDRRLRQGDIVLIFLRHVPELYGSFFGAMLGGFVPSFMPCTSPRQDPALYWSSHRTLLERIAPALIVADRQTLDEMAANGLEPPATLAIEEVRSGSAAWCVPTADRIGLLQHSSGTTGLKKGVALSYEAIAAQATTYAAAIGLRKQDVIASWLPLYHDMGLIACLIVPAFAAVPIVHLDPFEWAAQPGRLFDAICRHRATLCWLPNFAFDHLAAVTGRRAANYDISSVRAFINCSEPCKPASFDRFMASFGVRAEALQCCYAMAETVFAATQTRIGEVPRRIRVRQVSLERGRRIEFDPAGIELVESGSSLPGVQLAIQDEGGELLPEGYLGEVVIRCPFLFSGYNQLPEKTAEQLVDGAYRTRDLGFLHDGRIYVLGRIDDLLIVNGRNLYAHEVEAIVSRIEGIKPGRSAAVAQFDDRLGTQGLVIIAERTGTHEDVTVKREVSSMIFSILNVMPRAIHLVDPGWLVKTTSGKVSREGNLRKLLAGQDTARAAAADA